VAASEITEYAAELRSLLDGVGADATGLVSLTLAASNLAALAARGPGMLTEAEWNAAQQAWETARDSFNTTLTEALLGPRV
jgi:hypothetical protein